MKIHSCLFVLPLFLGGHFSKYTKGDPALGRSRALSSCFCIYILSVLVLSSASLLCLCVPRGVSLFPHLPSSSFSAPLDLGSQSCTFSISLPSNRLSTCPIVLESPWQQILPKRKGGESYMGCKRTLYFRTSLPFCQQ